MRSVLRIAAILLALAFCYPAHVIAGRAGRRPSPWPSRFLGAVGRIAGLRIRIEGTPRAAPVLLAANHVSWLDILALGRAVGAAFVAKAEIAGWPLIGALSRLNRTVFVARTERAAVRDQAETLGHALAGPQPIVLFAEGTTGDGRTVKPFRASLFAAVAGLNVPVQPVALLYDDPDAVLWPEDEPAGHNALRLLARSGRIGLSLVFLPPIDAAQLDRKTIAARAQQAVGAALAARDRAGGLV